MMLAIEQFLKRSALRNVLSSLRNYTQYAHEQEEPILYNTRTFYNIFEHVVLITVNSM